MEGNARSNTISKTMRHSVFSLALLCSGTLVLGSCGPDKAADNSTAAATETTAPAADDAADDLPGMDHDEMGHEADGATPQAAAMNAMMGRMDAMKMKGNTDHDFGKPGTSSHC